MIESNLPFFLYNESNLLLYYKIIDLSIPILNSHFHYIESMLDPFKSNKTILYKIPVNYINSHKNKLDVQN